MPDQELDAAYRAGGTGYNGDTSPFQSVTDTLGRVWNNLSGTTALNEYNSEQAAIMRQFNSAEAQKNRDWETFMSNTAHQRAVADLKAAGLNPMLAAGDAASTPSAAPASASAARSAQGGNGGFAGIIMQAACGAIARGLLAKFTGAAKKAADNHELVTAKVGNLAAQEKYYSARAAWYGRHAHDEGYRHTPEQDDDDDDMSDEEMYRILASIRKPS